MPLSLPSLSKVNIILGSRNEFIFVIAGRALSNLFNDYLSIILNVIKRRYTVVIRSLAPVGRAARKVPFGLKRILFAVNKAADKQ